MTFDTVLQDITKLTGIELKSIRPGADITIQEVDEAKGCIIIKTHQGKLRSRPISELKLIWNELSISPAVHVEGVLHGSGTSRNQPETIFANLPYIEYLKVNNKKHIAFVGQNSHVYGTIKQMDAISADVLCQKMSKASHEELPQILIVTDDTPKTISVLQSAVQGTISVISKGIYRYDSATTVFVISLSSIAGLPNGTYPILADANVQDAPVVLIGGKTYRVLCDGNVTLLVEDSNYPGNR